MKIEDLKFLEEKHVMQPDGVHDGLEELGLLVLIAGSLIILASTVLVAYVGFL
jgi:flagellar biosynthesis regulator FlbT